MRRDETTLLESIEGDSTEDWPASPAIQECTIESRTTGDVALLVGMAGKSFWSISIHFEADSLVFDVACRHQAPPAFLGSSYRVLAPGCLLRRADATESIELPTGDFVVQPADELQTGVTRWMYSLRVKE